MVRAQGLSGRVWPDVPCFEKMFYGRAPALGIGIRRFDSCLLDYVTGPLDSTKDANHGIHAHRESLQESGDSARARSVRAGKDSWHVGPWRENRLTFSSGGEKHDRFAALFDAERLTASFLAAGHPAVTVYGEAYGGSQQKQAWRYGPTLRFVAFDVKIGETWLAVPEAAAFVTAKSWKARRRSRLSVRERRDCSRPILTGPRCNSRNSPFRPQRF